MIWMYAQLHLVKPTAVLRHSRQALVTLASDLDGVIQNRAKIAIDQWREDSHEDIAVDAVFVKAKGSKMVIRAVIRRPVA